MVVLLHFAFANSGQRVKSTPQSRHGEGCCSSLKIVIAKMMPTITVILRHHFHARITDMIEASLRIPAAGGGLGEGAGAAAGGSTSRSGSRSRRRRRRRKTNQKCRHRTFEPSMRFMFSRPSISHVYTYRPIVPVRTPTSDCWRQRPDERQENLRSKAKGQAPCPQRFLIGSKESTRSSLPHFATSNPMKRN